MIVSGINIGIKKKNIKNMYLSVLPPMGNVRISAPLHASDEDIKLFALTKIDWIKKKVAKYENQTRQSENKYVSGESHYLWGQKYKLEINFFKKHLLHGNNLDYRVELEFKSKLWKSRKVLKPILEYKI